MLQYLVEHAGRLVSREELLEALWPDTYIQPEVLKSHIRLSGSCLGTIPKALLKLCRGVDTNSLLLARTAGGERFESDFRVSSLTCSSLVFLSVVPQRANRLVLVSCSFVF